MILAIDTATQFIRYTLASEHAAIGQAAVRSDNNHTVALAPGVDQLLSRAGVAPKDLTALAVTIGPGSFTGVRIGLGFAKGLALACGLPLIGVKTLECVVKGLPLNEGRAIAVIPAGRGRVIWAPYAARDGSWVAAHDGVVGTWDEVSSAAMDGAIVTGEIDEAGRQALQRNRVRIYSALDLDDRAMWLARIGWDRWRRGALDSAATLTPVYAHAPTSGTWS